MILYHSSNVYLLEHTGPTTPLSSSTSCYKKGDPKFVCLKKIVKLSFTLSVVNFECHSKVTSFEKFTGRMTGIWPSHPLFVFPTKSSLFLFNRKSKTSNYTNRLRAGKWAQTPFFNLVLLHSSSLYAKDLVCLKSWLSWIELWLDGCLHTYPANVG